MACVGRSKARCVSVVAACVLAATFLAWRGGVPHKTAVAYHSLQPAGLRDAHRRLAHADASAGHSAASVASEVAALRREDRELEKDIRKMEQRLEAQEKKVDRLEEHVERDAEGDKHEAGQHRQPGKDERTEEDDMQEAEGDDEVSDDRVERDHAPWPWQTWLCLMAAFVCTVPCVLACCGWSCAQWRYALVSEEGTHLEAKNLALVRREALLMIFYPLIPLALAPWTTCKSGMPTWGYAIYLPLLVRAKYLEWTILRSLDKADWSTFLSLGFLLGTLDHADWFTDGAFPIQAFKCEPEATLMFAQSFEQSFAWPLAPLVQGLRFWGAAYVVLLIATCAQQALAVVSGPMDEEFVAAADLCGFGAVSDHHAKERGESFVLTKILGAVARVLLENCLQLSMQSTFFGLAYDAMSLSAKIKVLLSMAFGLAGASLKIFQAFREVFRAIPSSDRWFAFPAVPFLLLAFCMIGWVAAKIYFAHACAETHLWNLTSGCVHAAN